MQGESHEFLPHISSTDKLRLSGHCACESDCPTQQQCPISCRIPAAFRTSTVRFNVASERLSYASMGLKMKAIQFSFTAHVYIYVYTVVVGVEGCGTL